MEWIVPLSILFNAVAALIAAISSFRNSRKLDHQSHATNSRLDELIVATRQLARAEGHREGLAEGRGEAR